MRGRLFPLDPLRASKKSKPWYERDNGARLAHDRDLIAEFYPGLSYHLNSGSGQYSLKGTLILRAECGVPTDIEICIVFPDNYPHAEPQAYDSANRFPHKMDRHFIADGRCCLWLPPKSQWNQYDADGLVGFIDQVALFFERQLICDALGGNVWPGEEYEHGAKGYLQYIQETLHGDNQLTALFTPILTGDLIVKRNAKCPCNSGLKYKRCHLRGVEEIMAQISTETIRSALNKG